MGIIRDKELASTFICFQQDNVTSLNWMQAQWLIGNSSDLQSEGPGFKSWQWRETFTFQI